MEYLALSGPLILTVGGVVTVLFGFRAWRMKRRIDDIPRSKVRSIAMGLVEVEGKAKGEKFLTAPLSGKKCFFYEYHIEKLMNEDEYGNRQYRTLNKGNEAIPFYVDDGTGKVCVKPEGAKYYVTLTTKEYSYSGKEPSERIKNFLRSVDVDYEGLLLNKRMRYSESLILPDRTIYVMGSAMHDKSAKSVSDKVVIGQGETDRFFFIGNQPEELITQHYRIKTIAFGIIGIFITFLGIFMATGIVKSLG